MICGFCVRGLGALKSQIRLAVCSSGQLQMACAYWGPKLQTFNPKQLNPERFTTVPILMAQRTWGSLLVRSI